MSVQDNGVVILTQDEWVILRERAPELYRAIRESNRILLSPQCGHTIEWEPDRLVSCKLPAGHRHDHENGALGWVRGGRSKKPWRRGAILWSEVTLVDSSDPEKGTLHDR